ncbi:MAG: tetratricopeptide repeat protein [bacterium]
MAIIIFLFAGLNTNIDSLKNMLENSHDFQSMIALHRTYQYLRMLDSANIYMKKYEDQFDFEEQAQLNYLMGDNLFFKGELLSAREQYLKTAAKFSKANYANEALERLHLMESARKDTMLLKRLATGIFLYEIKDIKSAEDSLKNLVKTIVGDYALYYLALVYVSKGEQNLVLATLEQLERDFSGHRIHPAKLLMAETYIRLGKKSAGKKMLEEFIIKYPNTPSAIRARELLKQLKRQY